MGSFKRINRSALSELIVHRKSHIISLILLGISGLTYLNTTMIKGDTPDPYYLSLFFFFISLFPLFFICVNVFKDMHDVPSADVQMAMPLSAKERFLSRIMTIGYVWFFPFLTFSSFGNIGSSILNQFSEHYHSSPAAISEMFAENLKIILVGICFSLFIIGVTVLCACCVGSKTESIYLPGILMITISVLPFETVNFIKSKFANISTESSSYNILKIFGFSGILNDFEDPFSVLFNILNCILSVLLIIIAMHAYEKRDARTVGYPIVYKVFFEVVLCSSLAVMFQLIHSSNYGVEIIALLIFFTGSIILRMIVSRKDITLIKILKWSGMFAVYYVLFLAFAFAACKTGGFGLKNQTPDTSKYSSKSEYTCYISFYGFDYQNYSLNNVIISEDEVLETAKICTDYIEKQNSSNYYFTDTMLYGLSRHYKDYITCYVSIDHGKKYSSNIYQAEIKLRRKDADKLMEKLSSLDHSNDQ